MGLSPGDLPVVSETEAEIAWLSRNPCPTLDACQTLGLDARHVCRAAYEKSTQALVSQLDPQLRFLGSYTEIRPHTDRCREWIVHVDFEAMMELAVEPQVEQGAEIPYLWVLGRKLVREDAE